MLASPVGPGRTQGNRCYRIKIKRNMKTDSEGRGESKKRK